MFAKSEAVPEQAVRTAAGPEPGERPSVISADLEVQGDLKSEGDIQIDGYVKGDVHSRTVVVSQGADIEGSIFANSVQISGRVKGQVEAPKVSILRSAEVLGDILHEVLEIESGAQFQGACRRLNNSRGESKTKPAA